MHLESVVFQKGKESRQALGTVCDIGGNEMRAIVTSSDADDTYFPLPSSQARHSDE